MGHKSTFVFILFCIWAINALGIHEFNWPAMSVTESVILAGVLTLIGKAKE